MESCKLRQLSKVWSDKATLGTTLNLPFVASTFHLMDIYPTSSQVKEMVLCAKECSKRAGNSITFGEFCVYASELMNNYFFSRFIATTSKCTQFKSKRKRNLNCNSASDTKYEVFLGGSCNPTTWRVDLAIPYLKDHDITYYNPQVAHWVPELIELESQAKQNAEVMFFVIDNQTRSIASMIEAAHIAGSGRKLALVIHDVNDGAMTVMGERISQRELRDLTQGHNYLRDLGERHFIPVFNTIPQALKWAAHLVMTDHVQLPHLELGDKLIKVREVFDDLDSHGNGWITLKDVSMAFKILNNRVITHEQLIQVVRQDKIDFDQFCCLYVEVQNGIFGGTMNKFANTCVSIVKSFVYPMMSWIIPSYSSETFAYDIYLGGSSTPSQWRKEIAIPLLKTQGLTSLTPQEGEWSDHYLPLEATALENCRVLLFVITANTRALAPMILASHYIGHNCEVVLCIQHLPEDITIDGEKLTSQGVKDYNRGRVYLSDLATRANVPVFSNIKGAVKCAMHKCNRQT